tara:strand:- start:210 stop:1046 length:837 start_codon:yes stop_codon:yes gene_type:complete
MVNWVGPALNVVSGILGGSAAKDTAKANLAANQASIAAADARLDKSLKAQTGGSAFEQVGQTDDGGFQKFQLGADSAAGARAGLAGMDEAQRVPRLNELTAQKFSPFGLDPDAGIPKAREYVMEGINQRRKELDRGAGQVTAAAQRAHGGLNSSNFQPSLLDALGTYYDKTGIPDPGREALDLFYKTGSAGETLRNQAMGNQGLMAPAPGFTSSTVGPTAATNIAQARLPATMPDLTSAVGPATIAGTVKNIADSYSANQRNQEFLDVLRTLGNKGSV